MKTNNDPKGLITHDSIMLIAPQELNDAGNWILVKSNKTHKIEEKDSLQILVQFPPLPTVNEGSMAMSQKSASSKHSTSKINFNKIFHGEKLASETPKEITIKTKINVTEKEKMSVSYSEQYLDDIVGISYTKLIPFNATNKWQYPC